MNNTDEFASLWRASAFEAVKYSDDFPECFLVLPELIDGAIAQGLSTKIIISIELKEKENSGFLKVTDNGKGVTDLSRLLSWASKENENVHHRYGHGSKKCLTKWNENYNSKWYVKYRTCDRRKCSSSLFTYNGPFQGIKKPKEEDENDEINLMPSGLEWGIEFNTEIFGKDVQKPKKIFDVIKEILRTRYSKVYFDKTEFIIEIKKGTEIIKESSKDKTLNWKSFQEMIEEEVIKKNCDIVTKIEEDFNEIKMSYIRYYLKDDSNELKNNFPFYGQRRMKSSRLHISLVGRIIETAPFWTFTSRGTNHNDLNGHFGFVNFEGDFNKAPTPATTKVSFYENCENYQKFVKRIKELDCDFKSPKQDPKPDLKLPKIPKSVPKPPKPVSDSNTDSDKESEPKPKPKSLNKIPKLEPKEPEVFYKVIYFEIDNFDEFDEIKLKCEQLDIKTFIKSKITKIDDIEDTKGYDFTIEAKYQGKTINHKFDQIIPNKKVPPFTPEIITIDDSTHDIKIKFKDPKDIGIPIKNIKIYRNNNKAPETIPFNKEITMSHQIHNKTAVSISFSNDAGDSNKTEKRDIKLVSCLRKDFIPAVIEKVLLNSDHKCSITGIRIDQDYNRYDIDHKNGNSCDIREENCQPLSVEIHSIKSNNKKLFETLKEDSSELFKYKKDKINGFLASLSNKERKSIKFNTDTFRFE
jgi:hypothetical protein